MAVAVVAAVAALPLLLYWLRLFKVLTRPNQTPIQKEQAKRTKEENKMTTLWELSQLVSAETSGTQVSKHQAVNIAE